MDSSGVKYYFPALDILRFFAAISVVVYHSIEYFSWTNFPTNYGMFWFRMGWVGVDIFFVISGFVISLAAFNHLDKGLEDGFRRRFMLKRFSRIVPLHYLTIIIFVIFCSPDLIYKNFISNAVSHLFFVHNLSYITHGDINGANWSLGVEMQFYLLIALMAPFLRTCKVYNVIIPVLIITYCWRLFSFYHNKTDTPFDVFLLFVWATQLPGMLDEFLVGYLLARFIRTEMARRFFYIKNISLWLFVFSCILFSLFIYIYMNFSSFWNYPYMVIFFRTYMALVFGFVILFLCALKINKKLRFLLRPFYYGGTISYGIYLWHLPVLYTVKQHLTWLSPIQAFTITLMFTLTLSICSWHFFEKKFLINKR